ncbi:MAG: CBS domain-containing protein, partial [Sphingobacteriales bacterium]
HIPVMQEGEPIGSISENGLFQKMFTDLDIRSKKVNDVMEAPFPLVDVNTPIERISTLINKENGAVLGRDESSHYHIVTKYDIIQSMAR